MAILQELIAPHTVQHFLNQNILSKAPYAAPFKAEAFKGLISWALLEEIFVSGHKDCWLPRHGLLPEEKELNTGRLTIEQAKKGFEQGRTVLIRHAERAHPILNAVAEDFFRLFHAPIDIQIYCTPAEQEGFNWHYDIEEVFVIQSQGQKEFRLKQNTVCPNPQFMPKDLEFEKETTKSEIRCLLEAGDWMFIPSGYWHKARAITDSFHMSVGLMKNQRLLVDSRQSLN